jgi:hypothetical protein
VLTVSVPLDIAMMQSAPKEFAGVMGAMCVLSRAENDSPANSPLCLCIVLTLLFRLVLPSLFP